MGQELCYEYNGDKKEGAPPFPVSHAFCVEGLHQASTPGACSLPISPSPLRTRTPPLRQEDKLT